VETARIAALLEPFLLQPLPDAALEQISTYIDLLRRWNARINLTAVRDPEAIVTRHFGESFFLAHHLFPPAATVERTPGPPECAAFARSGAATLPSLPVPESSSRPAELLPRDPSKEPPTYPSQTTNHQPLTTNHGFLPAAPCPPPAVHVLDIGSGAGFPGLPVKIWAPAIHLTLVESNQKKAVFLREVARALTLTDINVMTERAETLRLPPAQVVTFRAVERFETILPLAARFLAPAGRLALLIGSAQVPLLPTLVPHLQWLPPIPIPQSQSRILAMTSI
jgi:16S rRNA G527 N7-methylase RsmG